MLHQLEDLCFALAGQHMIEIQQEREKWAVSPNLCAACQSHSMPGYGEVLVAGRPPVRGASPLCAGGMLLGEAQEPKLHYGASRSGHKLIGTQASPDRAAPSGTEDESEIVSDLDRDSDEEDERKKSRITESRSPVSEDSVIAETLEAGSTTPSQKDQHRTKFLLLEQWRAHRQNERGVMDFLKALEPSLLTEDFDHYFLRDPRQPGKAWLPISPYSKVHTTHMALCFLLVTVDVFVIPFDASFAHANFNLLGKLGEAIMASLWTLDMMLCFITGKFEGANLLMHAQPIVLHYLRTWFSFDATLLLLRWWLLLDETSLEKLEALGMQMIYFRLLQLARMLRFRHWWYIMDDILLDAPGGVVLQGSLKLLATAAVFLHGIACGWYALGSSSSSLGWVSMHVTENSSHAALYLESLHWAVTQFHGSHDMGPTTEKEAVFAIGTLFGCYVLFACGIANLAQLMTHARNLPRERLQGQCRHYLSSKAVPGQLVARVDTALRQRGDADATQLYAELWKLFDQLPLRLRTDVSQSIKMPVFETHRFFEGMCSSATGSRAVRQLCVEAAKLVLFQTGEAVFSAMYKCMHMVIVESGRLHYSKVSANGRGISSQRLAKPRLSRSTAFEVKEQSCLPGLGMCEPVLWTKWQFCGDAVAARASTLLAIDSAIFGVVVSQFGGQVSYYASAYAKAFVKELNLVPSPDLSDLTNFDLNPKQLMHTKPAKTGEDEHYIFISHFKAESGTEAALLLDTLEKTLAEDTSHPAADLESPFFLDSEVLSDLSSLPKHVISSHNLVILLTNGVFTRRWCLEELVLAMRAGTYIIPCEIQRPGMQYKYPDAAFYQEFSAGKIVNEADARLLSEQGISLQECEDAIRYVSRLISVSFSPHKSLKIRTAEAAALLERCGMRDLDAIDASIASKPRLRNRSDYRPSLGHEVTLRSNAATTETEQRSSAASLMKEAFRARSVSSPPILDFGVEESL